MIRQSATGISPTLTIAIGDAPVDYNSVVAVAIDLRSDSHDMCEVTMAGVPARFVTEYIGKPVFVRMDSGPSYVSEFYGTIEFVKPLSVTADGTVNRSLLQEVVFVCFGTSYKMRGMVSRVWANNTLEYVAREFCSTYGLSLDVPKDDLVFENLTQSNESDWQFLVRYCDIMGYCVTVHGTHMHIFDPHKAFGRSTSVHKISTITRTGSKPSPGQITSFDGKFSRMTIDGTYLDASTTVHTDLGVVFDVSTSDVEKLDVAGEITTSLGTSVNTYDQAVRLLKSTQREDYDYTATAVVIGLLGSLPGGIVNLDRYDGLFDGLWYVEGVRHFLRTGMFVTTLDLRKNRVDVLWDKGTQAYSLPPKPTYVNDQWTSSYRTVNVYV